MRRVRLLLGLAALAAAIAALAVFGLASSKSGGRKAPALPHEQLAGPPTTLAQLLASGHGRPSLVVFWASWCGPCEREAPALEAFSRSAAGSGRIVGVDWSDGLSGARAFVKRYGWTFPVLRDAEGAVGNDYELTDLPTTFVIDSSGRIRHTMRGPQTVATLTRALDQAG